MGGQNMINNTSNRARTRARLFDYEWELKVQLRKVLDRLEPGLEAIDFGQERAVATGKIDITARDSQGNYVAIELKVGACPAGALEQVLGYAADLEKETGKRCKAFLVAGEFSPRIISAASRATDIRLIPYQVEELEFGESIPPYQ
jgi:RecB family endonuclease NucS